MALVIKDRIKETSTTTGTGTLTLAGASTGFKAFSEIGSGNTTYYAISDGTDWEVGLGTVGSGTLSRDTILASSNAGSAVSWNSDVKDVFCTYPADKAVYLDASGNFNISGGDITFGDNDKAIFGAGSDLQIYHDGSNSYIEDAGTGNLYIDGSNNIILRDQANSDAWFLRAESGAQVSLYHNGNKKLDTTSTGIDVTGTVTADVSRTSGVNADAIFLADNVTGAQTEGFGTRIVGLSNGTSAKSAIGFEADGGTNNDTQISFYTQPTAGGLARRVKIGKGGDISFYEDTGTTPKFFWDASAESLGIGTSSPSELLDVYSASTNARVQIQTNNTSSVPQIEFRNTAAGCQIGMPANVNAMTFTTADNERMRIDSSGNVGIGTSSPTEKLTVKSAIRAAEAQYDSATQTISATLRADINAETYSTPAIDFRRFTGGGNDHGTGLITVDAYASMRFYTDVKNTNTFATSERMRIDSNGNVGIGTTPSGYLTSGYVLRLNSSSTQTYLAFNNSTYTTQVTGGFVIGMDNASANIIQRENLPIKVYTNDTERMRIDSSGNVGIGTSSPSQALSVVALGASTADPISWKSATGNTGYLYSDSSGIGLFNTALAGSGNEGFYIQSSNSSFQFLTAGSERMRINSSGQLMLGVTTPASTFGDVAFTIRTATGANTKYAVALNKAGGFGESFIGNYYTNVPDYGLAFTVGNSGNVMKFNYSGNLTVPGGIYLGGTGAANYLDDYEEGTWTPVSGGQNMTGTATYTKVGRLVTVTFDITANSSASAADSIYGLPFAVASNHAGFTIGWTTTASGIESGYFNCLGTDMRLVQAGSGSAINIAANERIIGSGSYFTS